MEDDRLITGKGHFTDDLRFSDELHGVVVRSVHASARLAGVETAEAAAMAGVAGIVTAADLARDGMGDLPFMSTVEAPGGGTVAACCVTPVLARDAVRYVGEPVAFVVAESLAAARDAAECVVVHYEERAAQTDVLEAAAPKAERVHDGLESNIVGEWRLGDRDACDAAFERAAHRIALQVRNNRILPHAMEPRTSIGLYHADDRTWTLHCGNQAPHLTRNVLADSVLRVGRNRLRVRVGDIGGGFGGKITPYPEDALVLDAARRFARPVRWRGDRSECFLADFHARDHAADVEIAFDDSFAILGLRVVDHANLGAYASYFGIPIATTTGNRIATGVYRVPAIDLTVRTVLTNSTPTGPYRGAGRPEAIHRLERVLDAASARLGIDAAELRRRNMLQADDMPYRVASGLTYDSGDFPHVMARALALADWDGFETRRKASADGGKLRGRGLACHIDSTSGLSPKESVVAIAKADGGLRILSATQDMGQGLKSTYAQMAAEVFGMRREAVDVVQGDTALTPEGPGSYGSRSLYTGGAALLVACETLATRLKALAAEHLEVAVQDIELDGGELRVAGTDRRIAIGELAAHQPDREVRAEGESEAPFCFPNGCYVCEVEVEPETGVVTVDRLCGVDDVGNVFNTPIVHGQTHGGLVQGIGQAMLEGIRYDAASGQPLSGSLMDYALPRADDVPSFDVELDEAQPAATNRLGSKGAGESGAVGAPPAVVSAVTDALRGMGVDHIDMPLTPERVWRALRDARAANE